MLCGLIVLLAYVHAKVYFEDDFTSKDALAKQWMAGEAPPGKDAYGTWTIVPGEGSGVLATLDKERFYALSAPLDSAADNAESDLVVQLAVRYPEGFTCGGGYVKLFAAEQLPDPRTLSGETPYTLLFGPDYCGATRRVHVILGRGGESHALRKTIALPTDVLGVMHLYTLVLKADGTYAVRIDGDEAAAGIVGDDFGPPRTIADAAAIKPADWVDDAEMDDPESVPPADWNAGVPEFIVDADAEAPSDWDDEAEGAPWAAPVVRNPAHKGAWRPRRISNPAYAGPWAPPQIANPAWTPAVLQSVGPVTRLGFDLWEVQSNVRIGGVLVADDEEYARGHGERVWRASHYADSARRMAAISAAHAAKAPSDASVSNARKDVDESTSVSADAGFDEL